VIVISIEGGEPDVAVWGGLMTAGAVANGHAGAVLDGGVRDLVEIRRDYGFAVYARDVSPGTTLGRYKTVASQVPVRVGGIMVHPGDLIVGDVDGVVVVPKAKASEVLKMAQEIDARELEQAKLIIAEKSLRKGLAKYGRI
jgi:regulator of RNase E activity RraA